MSETQLHKATQWADIICNETLQEARQLHQNRLANVRTQQQFIQTDINNIEHRVSALNKVYFEADANMNKRLRNGPKPDTDNATHPPTTAPTHIAQGTVQTLTALTNFATDPFILQYDEDQGPIHADMIENMVKLLQNDK